MPLGPKNISSIDLPVTGCSGRSKPNGSASPGNPAWRLSCKSVCLTKTSIKFTFGSLIMA